MASLRSTPATTLATRRRSSVKKGRKKADWTMQAESERGKSKKIVDRQRTASGRDARGVVQLQCHLRIVNGRQEVVKCLGLGKGNEFVVRL